LAKFISLTTLPIYFCLTIYYLQRIPMTICAAIQMASGPQVSANLLEAEKLIAEAAKAGAKLVALPENFAIMGMNEFDKVKVGEHDGTGPIQDFLSNVAKKYGVWVVGGTIPIFGDNPNKVRAACLVINDQGQRVARYDKVHLFDVSVPDSGEEYRESDSIEAGIDSCVVDTPFGKLGIAVCYDLRFPEFFRPNTRRDLDIIVIPSAFTAKTGAAHWEVLLRARAIENLSYVIAPNQGGFHKNGRQTYGHSMIVDPWGVVLDCYKTGAGFVSGDIDKLRLEKTRASFPVLEHRRYFCE
jgi:nitrilase